MLDVFLEALLDSLKALPFLFGAYLLIEFLEHKASEKFTKALAGKGILGPIGGSLIGSIPQCGISVAAANFYSGRIITTGTLIAVFIATSDEAIPLMLTNPNQFPAILKLLGIKILAGVIFGIIVDLAVKYFLKPKNEIPFEQLCKDCNCEHDGIFKSALKHTAKIFVFLFALNIIFGYMIHFVGEETISLFLLSGSVFQPFLTSLIGFIPNCGASVILTELYMNGSLSFGSAIAGLCTGAGLGFAVLFKFNKNFKENFTIVGSVYVFAVLTGVLVNILGI